MLAMTMAGGVFAQSTVTTGSVKHVLIEEGTGAWCGYCTDGAWRLEQILANNPNAIGVSIHDGDPMSTTEGDQLMTAYSPNYPNGAVDRVPHSSGDVFMNRGYWSSRTTAQLAVAPNFEVTLHHGYNNTTKALTITVKAKALTAQTGKFNVNAYIVEDSVSGGSAYNQSNYDNTTVGHHYEGAGNPIVGFQHMQVVRKMLGGPWGSTGVITMNPAANASFSKGYTYELPTTANYTRYKIVAFVQKDTTSLSHRFIMNAVEAKVTIGTLSAIDEVNDNMSNLTVYPNPATDNVFVTGTLSEQSDVNISIVNAMGQVVAEKAYSKLSGEFNAEVPVEALNSGMYYIVVNANGIRKTERLVIAK